MFDPNTRILVVDDMVSMRKLVAKVCREIGFKDVVEVVDGKLAWEAINGAGDKPFGLIISDWNMPNMTGLELLKKVRAEARFHALPFVLLTAEAEKHQITEAVITGVDQYILKPFTPQGLVDKLELVYKKRSAA